MRARILALLAVVASSEPALAAVLEGTVRDKATDLPIAGATIVVPDAQSSVRTTPAGAFSLKGLPQGDHAVVIQGPGYLPYVIRVVTFRDDRPVRLRLALKRGSVAVGTRVISADRPSVLARTETSVHSFSAEQVQLTAGARNDPLLAIQSAAGVKAAGLLGAPAIRGGGPSDNRYYLDGIEIGNPYHFGGLVSVFNAHTLTKVDLYAGALPARYGDALSAVLDVETRPPATDRLHGVLEANLLYSEGLIEGPILPGLAFSLAGRRSYIDLIVGRFFGAGTIFPVFSDYQAKVEGALPGGGHLDLLGIGATDEARMVLPSGQTGRGLGSLSYDSGYRSTGAVWHQPIGEALASRFTVDYQEPFTDMLVGEFFTNQDFQYKTSFAEDLAWQATEGHQVTLGLRYDTINYVARKIQPDFSQLPGRNRMGGFGVGVGAGSASATVSASPGIPTADQIAALPKKTTDTSGNEKVYGAYVEDAWKPLEPLTLTLGARYDRLQDTGEDQVSPRAGVAWRADPETTMRLAYGQQFQFPTEDQLLPGVGNPALQAAFSKDYVAGIDRQFNEQLLGRFETYYRDLFGLITRDPSTNLANNASGQSYGAEATLNVTGWQGWSGSAALTLARTFRELPGKGQVPYDYDQPLVLDVSAAAPSFWGWTPSLRLRYASGRPYTPVTGRQQDANGLYNPIQGEANSARFPDGVTWSARVERPLGLFRLADTFYLEVTQQHEVLAIDYGNEYQNVGNPTYNYGLPPIPYLGYQVKF